MLSLSPGPQGLCAVCGLRAPGALAHLRLQGPLRPVLGPPPPGAADRGRGGGGSPAHPARPPELRHLRRTLACRPPFRHWL
eukprot:2688624-Rhodomonas_salina.1